MENKQGKYPSVYNGGDIPWPDTLLKAGFAGGEGIHAGAWRDKRAKRGVMFPERFFFSLQRRSATDRACETRYTRAN